MRGYSEERRNKPSAALVSFNRAVESASAILERNRTRFEALKASGSVAEEYARRVAVLLPQLSGMLLARADLLEEMEKPNEAKRDRDRIDALWSGGNMSVAQPMELDVAINVVANNAAVLDTRGYLYFLSGDLPRSLQDMEIAVDSAQWQTQAIEWSSELDRSYRVDLRSDKLQKRANEKILAALFYHRMLVLQKLGKTDRAAADRARVLQLGYEPTDKLF